ncbi:MAG: hypothetical protein VX747_05240, partial [Actinomycetota bacterium]|nr:hypothetical protein [Actinomycetota bacterium]
MPGTVVTGSTRQPVALCVTHSYISGIDIGKSLMTRLSPGGRHGLASSEQRDPIGYAVAALNKLAQSDLLDRVGLRKQAEQVVFTSTREGFRTVTAASRQFKKAGGKGAGTRCRHNSECSGGVCQGNMGGLKEGVCASGSGIASAMSDLHGG